MNRNQGTSTPLLAGHLLFGSIGTAAIVLLVDVQTRGYTLAQNPEVVRPFVQWSTAIAAISLTLLAITLAIEFAVQRGYDPPFLNTRFYGATVIATELPMFNEPTGSITLRPAGNHPICDYKAEMDELRGISEGDMVVVDVFGQHVTRVRKIKPSTESKDDLSRHDRKALKVATRQWRSFTRSTQDNLRALVLVPAAGYLVGANTMPLLFREDLIRSGRRYSMYESELSPGMTPFGTTPRLSFLA